MANITTRKLTSFDPFDVKSGLVSLADSYFQVKNLDTYQSGFLGYLIEALTFVTSDVLYQNAMAYNEAFLNRAILPSSVSNIAAQLDYDIQSTIPATGFLTIVMPVSVSSDMLVKIPAGSKVVAGNIPYKVQNNYYVTKDSTGITVVAQNADTGMIENVSYSIELRDSKLSIVFDVAIWQIDVYYHEFTFENPTLYVFYEEIVSGYTGQIHTLNVTVDGEIYRQLSSIYQARSDDRCYELQIDNTNNTLLIKFGNGVYGYLPSADVNALISVYTTLGASGNIAANTAMLDERIPDTVSGKIVNITSYNSVAITNGSDSESMEDIKRHVRENISAAKRLVTEDDFKGFQGVTGLTNVMAIPVLNRRDVVGNDVVIYTVMFDNENLPIPAASIPVAMNSNQPIITQGQEIEYEGNTYKSPFRIELNTDYDVPTAIYTYSLKSLAVTPALFSKSEDEDVLMGLRQCQAKLYSNSDQVVFIAEIYKLPDMTSGNISAILKIEGFEDIDLGYIKTLDDNSTINLSSNYIDSEALPSGPFTWTIELYHGADLYNTYQGEWTLFYNGTPTATEVSSVCTAEHVNTFLGMVTSSFVVLPNNDQGYFKIPIQRLNETDDDGNPVTTDKISVVLHFNGEDYDCTLNSIQTSAYNYISPYINLSELDPGSLSWSVEITYAGVITYVYNTYSGTIPILSSGRRISAQVVNDVPSLSGTPRIELVHLGLNSIQITSTPSGDYVFECEVSKMPQNNASYITARLVIEHDLINLEQDMAYDGETEQDNTQTTTANNTPASTVKFVSPNISPSLIPAGTIPFKIELNYNGELHAIYKQSAVFHHDMTEICYSHVAPNQSGVQYAWSVPVIESSYYDENLEYLDQYVFSVMATLRDSFAQYKMLTDRIQIKFAKTFGDSVNMRLNSYSTIPSKTYASDFSIDMPPELHIKVYVSKRAQSTVSAIVEECKNVLYTFFQLKAGFHTNLYRSEISRFIHDTVDDVEFCEVLSPTDDIVYNFDINNIPRYAKDVLYTYCPEFIWFDIDNITVDVVLMS